jgi:predicted kinase
MSETRERPLLIVVSGAPATGKTTLARRLSEALSLPLLAKDDFREILADAFGARSPAESRALIPATFAVYLAVLERLLTAGVGAIAEGNFFRGLAEDDLRPFLAHARAVVIHCHTDHDLSVRRFIERHERPGRHPCFYDGERVSALLAGEWPDAWTRAQPIELGVPPLLVDTTEGYVPSFEDVLAFVRAAGTLSS